MSTITFQRAFAKTMQHERGFGHDPDDPGDMTYMGISRANYPDWHGWKVIDDLLAAGREVSTENPVLMEMVRNFYLGEFWEKLLCEEICRYSTGVAIELFDTAVHTSHRKAIRFLQEALNLNNGNQKYYSDIDVDGILGPVTMGVIRTATAKPTDDQRVIKLQNSLQAEYYIKRFREDPTREKYRGWFERT